MMKVLIVGGTGFIGTHLSQYLHELGHEVFVASRSVPHFASTFQQGTPARLNSQHQLSSSAQEGSHHQLMLWPLNQAQEYTSMDAIINLAGESINQRWTRQAKERIVESRVSTTKQIINYINKGKLQARILINASAIGYYGSCLDERLTEASPQGNDFLAEVARKWEEEAEQVTNLGVRLVKARIGLVLAKDGGALPKMILPYKLYTGGTMGTGKQWVSWIHLTDLLRLFDFCLTEHNLQGAINCTAPNPVPMKQFGQTIAKIINKPHWLPAPSFALRLLLGEMSDLILKGQKVFPKKALDSGFHFQYTELEPALSDILS